MLPERERHSVFARWEEMKWEAMNAEPLSIETSWQTESKQVIFEELNRKDAPIRPSICSYSGHG